MTSTTEEPNAGGATYLNPVYGRDFPDPFILKHCGEYWAYSTGFWRDGRAFGVMHSRDLVHWRELKGALVPLPGEYPCYWAPEVVYENGRFLMYYSVGNEKRMHIRVATASHPAGLFTDSGHQLTDAEFAIDPHVFIETDGTRWLFYATDFLTHTHIGTGTVRERMLDPFTLAGDPQPVTRARYDWQVYDPARKEKGGVRWHTVEGPFVLRRKNLYYQLFSGGNWQNLTYGVSYAVSDRIERAGEWEQAADGERVLPILRTVPGRVIGPGHNSVVRAPDNQQLFCVYHRWDGERGRVLAIDRLDWVGERMTVLGATTTPQPAPTPPTFAGFHGEHEDELGEGWTCAAAGGARWSVREGEARGVSAAGARASARRATGASSFILEVSLRAVAANETGAYGVELLRGDSCALEFTIEPEANEARVRRQSADDGQLETRFALPADFAPRAFHLLRVVVDESFATIFLDERVVRWQGTLNAAPDSVALVAEAGAQAAFKGFELTHGWEELFTQDGRTLAARGWQHNPGDWRLEDGLLRYDDPAGRPDGVAIHRGPPLESYELVVNARLERKGVRGVGGYGFYPASRPGAAAEPDPQIAVEPDGEAEGKWLLVARNWKNTSPVERWPLPASFDPFVMQQFRFRKQNGRLSVHWEAEPLCELDTTTEATGIGLYAVRAHVAFDMVRVTRTVTSDE
ncbi:MAG TPA: glycoside hydrolase family 43 protein [Pyrinomonadaceae bacterium]|jgi:GH43 family beta-xylosidase|nr:glycoside hydrolase family 43 protein [Pyrinomonadaceae bacterium]